MFDLVNNKVIIPPSALTIPEIKLLWSRDKKKNKEKAYSELCYVFHMCDIKSEYANYDSSTRSIKVREDQIKEDKWKPDKAVKSAIIKYKEMKTTASMRFLDSQQGLIDKITLFINDYNIDDLDEKSMKIILESSKKAQEIILMLPKLKQQVAKEQVEAEHVRGGGTVGAYEE